MDIKKPLTPAEYRALLSKEDKRAVKNLNDKEKILTIPTGSWVVDRLIGDGSGEFKSGGLPRGHIVELFGDESCGKTTLGMSAAVEAQRQGLIVVWQDYERTFSKTLAQNMGMNLNDLIFQEPDHFEHGAKLLGQALQMHPGLIVVDSVAAMIPAAFLDFASEDPTRLGEHARLMSKFLGAMGKYITEYKTCLLLINQLRSAIKGKYEAGPSEDTTGGKSPKYYASVRIQMMKKKIDYIKVVSKITGEKEDHPNNIQVKVTIKKNKVDKPYFSGPIYIKFGEGIDNITSIIELAVSCNVLKKSGAFFKFTSGDQVLVNIAGRENLRDFLEKNQKILQILSSSVKLKVDEEAQKQGEEEEDIAAPTDMDSILGDIEKSLESNKEEDPKEEPILKEKKKGAKGKNS